MRDTFRFAEKCLYGYKQNIAGLDVLRNDLQTIRSCTDVHAQNYDTALTFTGTPSDPVQNRLIKIETLEARIQHLERMTQPVTRLVNDLTAPYVLDDSKKTEMYELMQLYYFGQNSINSVMEALHMSRRNVYNRRKELVKMAMAYLGYSRY